MIKTGVFWMSQVVWTLISYAGIIFVMMHEDNPYEIVIGINFIINALLNMRLFAIYTTRNGRHDRIVSL